MSTQEALALADRLVAGQRWLTAAARTLNDGGHTWSPERRQYANALDQWYLMEGSLRELPGFRGCIHGHKGPCPLDADPWCSPCAERSFEQEQAVQERMAV